MKWNRPTGVIEIFMVDNVLTSIFKSKMRRVDAIFGFGWWWTYDRGT